jgi:hypothetical protein
MGHVRRVGSDGTLAKTSDDSDSKFKEFTVRVKRESGQSSTYLASLSMGNVTDETGARVSYDDTGTTEYIRILTKAVSDDGQDAVYTKTVYDGGTVQSSSMSSMWHSSKQVMTRMGDLYESGGAQLGINPDTEFDHIRHEISILDSNGDIVGSSQFAASGFYRIDTNESIYFIPQKKFTVTCDDIRLGDDDPSEHYVLGDSYRAAEKQYVSDLRTQISNIVSQLQTLTGIVAGFNGATDSVGGPIGVFTSVSGTTAPIQVQLGQISSQLSSIEQTFNNGTNDYLSQIITGK